MLCRKGNDAADRFAALVDPKQLRRSAVIRLYLDDAAFFDLSKQRPAHRILHRRFKYTVPFFRHFTFDALCKKSQPVAVTISLFCALCI